MDERRQIFSKDALAGRTILVTGASSGIGRAASVALAAHGARLVLTGRDPDRLEQTMAMIGSADSGSHAAVTANLEDPDLVAELVKSIVSDHGTLDGIFHSAGAELVRPMRMTKRAQLDMLFGAALYASFGIARAASQKGAVSDGASLVFMSSVSGSRGTPGMAAYSAAKAAVDGMVRSLACELAPRRVRVNSIVAGAVTTEMHGRLGKSLSDEGMADYEGRHLLGFGSPADIADAALFLLSDASQWITGTAMCVDGGYCAR